MKTTNQTHASAENRVVQTIVATAMIAAAACIASCSSVEQDTVQATGLDSGTPGYIVENNGK